MQSLRTAARRQLPLVVVVPRNADYAVLKSVATQDWDQTSARHEIRLIEHRRPDRIDME